MKKIFLTSLIIITTFSFFNFIGAQVHAEQNTVKLQPQKIIDYSHSNTTEPRLINMANDVTVQWSAAVFQVYEEGYGLYQVAIESTVYVGYNFITKGDAVSVLQAALVASGFNPGSIDGVFGPNTRQALINFQVSRGLSADGVAGPNTWMALSSACQGKVLYK